MKGFGLRIALIEDCILSERGATEGGHRGLDYVPGGSLLGFAASRLYRKLTARDAFTVFHSGRVRFRNALPSAPSGEPAWPTPLCWHHDKTAQPSNGGRLNADRVEWLVPRDAVTAGSKLVQIRRGFVTTSGVLVAPPSTMRLKTAIEPTTGRAREGALFGYQAIRAGARFHASVEADDDVPAGLIDSLREAFRAPISIGRSRSAEYGHATAEVSELANADLSAPATRTETTTLWLLSDLEALDGDGQPTVAPRPEWLGLPEGELVLDRSFLRARRYSPWNAKRGGPDIERQVLVQGSVLTYRLARPLNASEVNRIQTGLGLHRESGLGQVWIDPPLLVDRRPTFAAIPAAIPSGTDVPRPPSALIDWLEQQVDGAGSERELGIRARQKAHAYGLAVRSARLLLGLGDGAEIGPSHSQWGSVLATSKSGADDLDQQLFDDKSGLCRRAAPGWRDEYWDERAGRPRRFGDWLREAAGESSDPRFIQLLAREVMAVVKSEQRR